MSLQIHQFACLSDNYGFLVRDTASGQTACIDTPDADAILAQLKTLGWGLDLILNTHWHPDHAGGNAQIKAATGAVVVGPQEVERIGPLDRTVKDADQVTLGQTTFTVMDTGGHTLGHVSYYSAGEETIFVGDTLFALGCGRLFEGTPDQMWTSLSRLIALPDDTAVYCAHEYTEANVRFALSVEPGNQALQKRAREVSALRAKDEFTLPSAMADELAANPFLRPESPEIRAHFGLAHASNEEVFAALRQAKDHFR